MKPLQREAKLQRQVAKMAKTIPDKVTLDRIIETIPERPKKQQFLNSIHRFLKFDYPEVIHGSQSLDTNDTVR